MVRSLYISVDMEKHISITSYPVDGFRSVGGHFGVVLIGQSNGEVIVHISWLGKTHLLNLWSSWWIPNCQKLWSCVFPCQLMCTVTSSCMMCTMTSPYDWPWKSTQKWLSTCENPFTGSEDKEMYTGVYCSNLLILFHTIGWIISTFLRKYYMDFNINNFKDLYFESKFHNLPKFDGGFWVITFPKHYLKV